ncbi:MAG: hypothetical protein DVS81_20585, partial [Candidatus Accumulibacter meliphilus]
MRPGKPHFETHSRRRQTRIDSMSTRAPLPFFALLLAASLPIVQAEDLGVVGPTYDIAEPDLLEAIESRLKHMEKTGELARKQNEHRDRVVAAVE